MIKNSTTVKAKDTSTAMEKIIAELGEDCVILSTKKRKGMIEITASNSAKYKSAVKKRYDKQKFSNIYNLKSGKMNIDEGKLQKVEPINNNSNFNADILKSLLKKEMLDFSNKLDKKLENIYLTDYKNTSKNVTFSNFLKLKQLGFENDVLTKYYSDQDLDDSFEVSKFKFYRRLSEVIVAPFPERIFKSKLKCNVFHQST